MTPNRLPAIAFRWSITAVFALWLFAPNAKAQSAATTINGAYCVASQIGQRTVYFSESFGTPESDLSAISEAYKAYLAQKYFKGSWGGGCNKYATVAAAEEAKQQRLAESKQGRWTIEQTGWKYAAPAGGATSSSANKATTTAAATQGGATGSSASVVQNSAPPTARPTPSAAAAGGPFAQMQAQVKARDEEENRQRWARPGQSPAAYDPQWMGQNVTVTGTVSRVDVDSTGSPHWLTIYFKESPKATFVVCSPYPDMFQDLVGRDLSALIGKTLEVGGQVETPYCGHKVPKGSIRVLESAQWRVEAPQMPRTALAAGNSQAEPPSGKVDLSVCNTGKVDIDVFVAKQGPVASSHIAPAACARVYGEDTAVPAYVGFALADSRGQWGAARRLDLLPDFYVLTRADKNVSVRRGQLQLLFLPRKPTCSTLIHGSTDTERAYAEPMHCETLGYVLNAVAYPDSQAITLSGRFTRFVDGCNAFYRDPANSKYLHSTAWCQCLSDQYQGVMTPEEESRYGNDFKRLFLDQIAQPQRNSTDPAWPRLHPARDRCAQ